MTEGDAQLLWSPSSRAGDRDPLFVAARAELSALRPRYIRLLVNWAALQPDARGAPALEARVDGCARGVGPCSAFAGLRDELASIASQQHAGGPGSFQVLIDVLGTPAWAATPAHGCEQRRNGTSARTLSVAALPAYRALIGDVLELGRREGAQLEYWSPWNEPNDARFLDPQRAACASASSPLAPAAYAQLVEAMSAELTDHGGVHSLVLGELAGVLDGSPHRTGIDEFVAALPEAALCAGDIWSVHAYARWDARGPAADPVGALEQALAARHPACRPARRIWVTETGAGAPRPGRPRAGGVSEAREGCMALAQTLAPWMADPAVTAVFQYTFREDPAYPVGLASADMSHLYPTYSLWRRFAGGASAASLPSACQ